MQFRAQTEFIAAVLALAIAMGVVLRTRKRRLHWFFVAFAGNVALWYLAQALNDRYGGSIWSRAVALSAVLLPQPGIRFLRAFVADAQGSRRSRLTTAAGVLGAVLVFVVISPYHAHPLARGAVSLYVIGLFAAVVVEIYERSRAAESRLERARARYLVGVGTATTLVFMTDVLPYAGLDVGPAGIALVLVVLFMLSQVMERSRLIDLYELAGRLFALTALAFLLAAIYYLLVDWARGRAPYVLNAIVASLVILILFDPVRAKIEEQIARFFFRERFDLERSMNSLRQRLAHALELDAIGRILLEGLESSRRVTHASMYLVDPERRGVDLFVHLGPAPVARLELAAARPLLDRLTTDGAAVTEELGRDAAERRDAGEVRESVTLAEAAAVCKQLEAAVVLPIEGDQRELIGLLALRDDRMRDPFSPEEVQILRQVAAQVALVIENSKQHGRIKERDRLAALGEMAAGLAHEIRNPLGSIMAAAQLMEGTVDRSSQDAEFLGIIVEEVARLNRVVGSFLDYARPYRGSPTAVDVSDSINRTVAVLRNDLPANVKLVVETAPSLPPVRIDAEHLRQVVLNLVRNAVEAMEARGEITILTQMRAGDPPMVEVLVRDTGPGISAKALPKLFVPFFTTKAQGTGLGLAICQRLISSAGGRIEVRTQGGRGTTFVVAIPVAERPTRGSIVPPAAEPASLPGVAERSGEMQRG
jgi:signal transduction histidine kinase